MLEKEIFPASSTETLFNQYKDINEQYDLPDGAVIRRKNLKNYFESFLEKPQVLMVGEAAGPWGCRFSGVPFTSEAQLAKKILPFTGKQSSKRIAPYSENSASTFWKTLSSRHQEFIIWNLLPFHPHKPNNSLSIRNPNKGEVAVYSKLLVKVKSILQPKAIIAVGRKAEQALSLTNIHCTYVRHPSQAGARLFANGINQIFSNLLLRQQS